MYNEAASRNIRRNIRPLGDRGIVSAITTLINRLYGDTRPQIVKINNIRLEIHSVYQRSYTL